MNKAIKKIAPFLSGVIFLFTFGSFVSYTPLSNYLIKKTKHNLKTIFDNKAQLVTQHIQSSQHAITKLCSSKEFLQAINSKQNDVIKNEISKQLTMNEHLETYIFDANAILWFTNKNKQHIGKNFLAKPFNKSPLGKSLLISRMILLPDVSSFTNIFTEGKISYFISQSLFYNKQYIGTIALEFDAAPLLKIVDDYAPLGSTGESVLGQMFGPQTRFINHVRNQPSLAFQHAPPLDIPLYKAIKGDQKSYIAQDYRQQEIVAFADYIPIINAGMVVKKDLKECLRPLFYLDIFFLFAALFFIIMMCLYLYTINVKSMRLFNKILLQFFKRNKTKTINICLFSLLGLSILSIFTSFYRYEKEILERTQATQHTYKTNVRHIAHKINLALSSIRRASNQLLETLNSKQSITQDEMDKLVTKIHVLHKNVFGITIAFKPQGFNSSTKLYAPYWINYFGRKEFHKIHENYDYTLSKGLSSHDTDWYTQAFIKQQPHWQPPYFDTITRKKVISYSVPFYLGTQQPQGVICITYPLKHVAMILENLGQTALKKSVIVDNKTGNFIYHPKAAYIFHEQTIYDLTRKTKSIPISKLLDEHLKDFTSPNALILSDSIPLSNWRLATSFSIQDVNMPSPYKLKLNIHILLSILFFCFILGFIVIGIIYNRFIGPLTVLSTTYAILVGLAIITLWTLLYSYSLENDFSNETKITEKLQADRFIDNIRQEAQSKNQPAPIPMKTGISIHSIDISEKNFIELSGIVWQKYPKNLKETIKPAITFHKSTELDIEKVLEKEEKNNIVIGWKVKAKLAFKHQYRNYPFNKENIVISLQNTDISQPTVPVPDFKAYNPKQNFPWLDPSITFPGLELIDSFYSFKKKNLSSSTISKEKKLRLHIILRQNLFNAFISYFLPFLVILISIFCIVWLQTRHGATIYNRVSTYSALALATIFLQLAFRSQLLVNDVVYAEYLFFFAYFTILILILHSIFCSIFKPSWEKSVQPLLLTLFWPFQVTMWFLATVLHFY